MSDPLPTSTIDPFDPRVLGWYLLGDSIEGHEGLCGWATYDDVHAAEWPCKKCPNAATWVVDANVRCLCCDEHEAMIREFAATLAVTGVTTTLTRIS